MQFGCSNKTKMHAKGFCALNLEKTQGLEKVELFSNANKVAELPVHRASAY